MDVLLHQNEKNGESNILIINGEKGLYSGSANQKAAVAAINNVSKQRNQRPIPCWLRKKPHAPSFKLYIDGKALVLVSNFVNPDDSGRTVSFSFYCESRHNAMRAKKLLTDYSSIAGMALADGDVEMLRKCLNYYNGQAKRIGVAFALFVGIVGLILLCKH